MDFAALMSKEIEKAKPNHAIKPAESNSQKFVKRADLEKERQAAYEAEQARIQAEKEAKALKKRKHEEEEEERNREREDKRRRLAAESRARRGEEEAAKERARRKRLGLPELPSPSAAAASENPAARDGSEDSELTNEELISKLRELNEPATLFGENQRQRLRRYKRVLASRQSASTAVETAGLTSLERVSDEQMKVPDKVPKDEAGKKFLFRQLASYFTMVLEEWALALAQRPAAVKTSFQGKAAHSAMLQSRESMAPLFRKFEKGELDILAPVVEIVKAAQERRYVDANDGYLRLSIGKAAWPIGVTMVGIHERSAREKLHESEAHIMSDEVTRKFLQSIKRCLSFAQTRWPPFEQGQLMG
ncbi:MAG: hypothetical protein M1825_005760 [Sarcosagium campestre]|nr:MAG: hypothetical protein M1825_005760 [Sarcosagium campestre]